MADADDQNPHLSVLNLRDDAVVADAVLPEIAEPVAVRRLAQHPRVIERAEPLVQEAQDAPRGLLVESVQLAIGGSGQVNPPGHTAA